VPARRQKVKSVNVDPLKIPPCGIGARGLKLSSKPVERVDFTPSAASKR